MDLPNAGFAGSAPAQRETGRRDPRQYARRPIHHQRCGFSCSALCALTYNGFFFSRLAWSVVKPERNISGNQGRLDKQLSKLRKGTASASRLRQIPGVGTSGGFQFVLEDRVPGGTSVSAGNLRSSWAARSVPKLARYPPPSCRACRKKFLQVDGRKC